MFKFLRGSAPKDARESVIAPESVSPPSSRHHSDIQRELIRVVLKDTLRLRGIPFDWISCEIIVIPHGTDDEELHIQLVLMKWQETFLRYAPALERQLLRGLDRFDPTVDHSKYIISWRFSPECGCPFTVLPPPMFWAHAETPADLVEEESSILDRRHAKRAPKASIGGAPALNTGPDPTAAFEPPAAAPVPPPDDANYQRTQLSPFR